MKVNVVPSMALLRKAVWENGGMPEAVAPNSTHWRSSSGHYEATGNGRTRQVAVWRCDFLGWMDPEEAGALS